MEPTIEQKVAATIGMLATVAAGLEGPEKAAADIYRDLVEREENDNAALAKDVYDDVRTAVMLVVGAMIKLARTLPD
jgi:hypothetical protein